MMGSTGSCQPLLQLGFCSSRLLQTPGRASPERLVDRKAVNKAESLHSPMLQLTCLVLAQLASSRVATSERQNLC